MDIKDVLQIRNVLQTKLDNYFYTGDVYLTDVEKNSTKNAFPTIKEAYKTITNDINISGSVDLTNNLAVQNSNLFSQMFLTAFNKKFIRDWNLITNHDAWKKVCQQVNLLKFIRQTNCSIYGFGSPSEINTTSEYSFIGSPAWSGTIAGPDTFYGATKLLLTDINNNNDSYIRRMPTILARNIKSYMFRTVMDQFKNNVNSFDSKAVFHVDHNNLGSAALDSNALSAARLLIVKNNESAMGSNSYLGRAGNAVTYLTYNLKPKYLIVPTDLELLSYNLTKLCYGQYNDQPSFIQTQNIEPIIIDYWSDVNNWYLITDPNAYYNLLNIPCMQIGFWGDSDIPNNVLATNPASGSTFASDGTYGNNQITLITKKIWAISVCNFVSSYGAIVAG